MDGTQISTQSTPRNFNRDIILGLDDEEFSPAEKRHLLDMFFPRFPRAPWQDNLMNVQRWRRYLDTGLVEPHALPCAVATPSTPRPRN